jgi:hypothetical protein
MMVRGHELGAAKQAGFTGEDQGYRSMAVSDAVIEQIGEERLIAAFIDCNYEMHTEDKQGVIDRALEVSGYNEVRNRLFPEPT